MSRNRNSYLFIFILTIALVLILGGCAGKTNNKANNTNNDKETKAKVDNFDLKLAGGRYGYKGMAVVGGGQSNKLWIVDARYHKIVTTIDAGWPKKERTKPELYPNLHDTHAITFTKDFKVMWTADWFDYNEPSYVIAFDPLTFKEIGRVAVGKGAHHTALSPDDKFLYAANEYGASVSVVDTKTMTKIKDLPTGEGPDYITPSMYWNGKPIDTPYLFVSVDKTNAVTVIDWKKNEVVKNIDVGASQHGVNLTPDGKFAWVAAIGGTYVPVIDVKTLKVVKKIKLAGNPIHIVFSPDSKYAYVSAVGDLVYKIDTSSYKTVWKVKGTVIPAHMGLSPDGKELWTLNHGMDPKRYPYMLGGQQVNGIQIFETDKGTLINEIAAEAMPHEIQFVPYSTFGTPPKPGAAEGGATGKTLYGKNCASCHGASGEGDMAPGLKDKKWSDTAKTAKIIREGAGKGMPAFKDKLKEKEITDIAQYVATFSTKTSK